MHMRGGGEEGEELPGEEAFFKKNVFLEKKYLRKKAFVHLRFQLFFENVHLFKTMFAKTALFACKRFVEKVFIAKYLSFSAFSRLPSWTRAPAPCRA